MSTDQKAFKIKHGISNCTCTIIDFDWPHPTLKSDKDCPVHSCLRPLFNPNYIIRRIANEIKGIHDQDQTKAEQNIIRILCVYNILGADGNGTYKLTDLGNALPIDPIRNK